MLALVGDEVVDGPFAVCEALFGQLDPDVACAVGLCGRDVGQDGSVVGLHMC